MHSYAWPAAIALVTLAALVAGLAGTRAVDTLAVLALAAPTGFCLWKLFRAGHADRREQRSSSARTSLPSFALPRGSRARG